MEQSKTKKRMPGQKRKGLGGLSPEKKRLLKQLIMQKAAEEMKAEENRRQEARENHLKQRVAPLKTDLNEDQCKSYIKQLHQQLTVLEEEKYDWEVKLRRQEYEINELNLKVNDVKGKFVKPVLKKVNKTESKLARFEKKRDTASLASFRNQLKSTSSHKYALEEKEEGAHKNPDWREHLKDVKSNKDEHGEDGEVEVAEGEGGDAEAEATVEIEE